MKDVGEAELWREWSAAYPQDDERGSTEFDWRDIASVERRPYSDLESVKAVNFRPEVYWPWEARRMRSQRNGELQSAECVILVFSDGQELPLGWAQHRNRAAVLQSQVRDFIGQMASRSAETVRNAVRAASIAPGDAPL